MSMRRHSHTPAVLTRDQQEYLVKLADDDADLRTELERATQTEWAKLNFQQKVKAVGDYQERGYMMGSLAGAARGATDLKRELDRRDFGIETQDRLLLLEQENSELRESNAELRRRLGVASKEAS